MRCGSRAPEGSGTRWRGHGSRAEVTLLRGCGYAVALANAVPVLKENADFVTRAKAGKGVVELAEHLLAHDLRELPPGRKRRGGAGAQPRSTVFSRGGLP